MVSPEIGCSIHCFDTCFGIGDNVLLVKDTVHPFCLGSPSNQSKQGLWQLSLHIFIGAVPELVFPYSAALVLAHHSVNCCKYKLFN